VILQIIEASASGFVPEVLHWAIAVYRMVGLTNKSMLWPPSVG